MRFAWIPRGSWGLNVLPLWYLAPFIIQISLMSRPGPIWSVLCWEGFPWTLAWEGNSVEMSRGCFCHQTTNTTYGNFSWIMETSTSECKGHWTLWELAQLLANILFTKSSEVSLTKHQQNTMPLFKIKTSECGDHWTLWGVQPTYTTCPFELSTGTQMLMDANESMERVILYLL